MKFVRQIFRSHRTLFVSLGLILATLLITKFIYPMYLRAQTAAPSSNPINQTATPADATAGGGLAAEIEQFFGAGAQAYLVWQFNGDKTNPFETDQYSFFRHDSQGDAICKVLSDEAAKHPDKYLGVNIHSAPKPEQVNKLDAEMLGFLSDSCGTRIIRVFSTDVTGGISGAQAVLAKVDAFNQGRSENKKIRVIVAMVDFNVLYPVISDKLATWYASTFEGSYIEQYSINMAKAIGQDDGLFGLELMNEPHCAGQGQACWTAYTHWSTTMAAAVKPYVKSNVGIGQFAHDDLSYFVQSNTSSNITMASGHYYKAVEKQQVLQAAAMVKNITTHPFFYIGEAPATVESTLSQNPVYEFNIQRETSQKVLGNFYDEYALACLPKQEYSIAFENTDKCGQAGYSCPADWKSWNVAGNLSFTADGKGFGLFRNEAAVDARTPTGAAPSRFESVESYLSTPNQTTSNTPVTNGTYPDQAPIYSLTDFVQQCTYVINKLQAVENLCKDQNRVELYTTAGLTTTANPNNTACALNTIVTGTSNTEKQYKQLDLLNAFRNKTMTCQQLVDSAGKNADDKKFLTDLLKVNLSMDTAYRPAFVVAVTEFDGPNSPNNITTDSDPAGTSGKFQVVDYLEVKVPAIATDFLPPNSAASSDQMNSARNSYQDPVQLSANALTSKDFQDTATKQQIDDRAKLRTYGNTKIGGGIVGKDGMPFFCNINGNLVPNCDTHTSGLNSGTGPNYVDQIPTALVQFINANYAAKLDSNNWDELPCEAAEVSFYDAANTKHIAETASSIISQLSAQKAGPYDKKTQISTKINVKVKDVTSGGGSPISSQQLNTHTQLYFVSPQRYAMLFAQKAFMSFLSQDQQKAEALAALDPSSYSPLLKSELNKTLTGSQTKTGTRFGVAPLIDPANPNATSVVNNNTFDLTAKLKDLGTTPNQSFFWRMAGQVASLPTRIMALINTQAGTPINDYTKSCTGNTATEDWFTGKCLGSSQSSTSTSPSGTTGGMCIETTITDTSKLQLYAIALKRYLAQAATKDLWSRYFAGYLKGAPQLLFSSNDGRCNPSGNCYDLVIDTAVANHLNPYLAIAIALNETGGLKSDQVDGSGPHFGCGVNTSGTGPVISSQPIPVKLECLMGALAGSTDANQSLTKYGYVGGYQNANLSKIIGIISNDSYTGTCK